MNLIDFPVDIDTTALADLDPTQGRQVFDAVVAARNRIDLTGWCQDVYGTDALNPEGCRVCAVGALRWATTGTLHYSNAATWLAVLVGNVTGVGYLPLWNDNRAKSRHDVTDLFERFALHVADTTDPTGRWQLTGEHPDGFAWKIEGDGGSWGWTSYPAPVDWGNPPGDIIWEDDGHDSALEAHERMIDVSKELMSLGAPA